MKASPMILRTSQLLLLLLVTTVLMMASVGCNTAHGLGKDVESAGEAIQEGTD